MDADHASTAAAPHLVTKIVKSYVLHHRVSPEQVAELIESVHAAIDALGKYAPPEEARTPAVPVRRSVSRDAVICLECGLRAKTLRKHLHTRHHLTPEAYRRRWGLPADHLLTAPSYSERRSQSAKQLGLGRERAAAQPRTAERAEEDAPPAAASAPELLAPAPIEAADRLDPVFLASLSLRKRRGRPRSVKPEESSNPA